jgi:two-component sensor histidine kinase/PAS domain-containing protein
LTGSRIRRDLLAAVLVGCALATRLALLGPSGGLEPFYLAVLAASLLGFEPGALAVVLSWLAVAALASRSDVAVEAPKFALTAAAVLGLCEIFRRKQVARLRNYELFEAMQTHSIEGLVFYRAIRDAQGAIVDFEYRYANPAALAITRNKSVSDLEGVSLLTRLPPARDHPALFPRYREVLQTGQTSQTEYELGGQWYQSVAAKLDDGVVVSVQSITERKRAEAAQHLLLQELNHRVKNLLAAVIAMASLSGRTASTPTAYRDELLGRLHALSRAHGLLSNNAWTDADVLSVVFSTLEPYLQADRDRFEIAGEPVRVSATGALALHMALHELATNAVKYGAFASEGGRVAISWSSVEDPFALLLWSESGGPPVKSPERRGLGSRLFESVFASEGGSTAVDYEAAGVVARLKFRRLVEEAPPPST